MAQVPSLAPEFLYIAGAVKERKEGRKEKKKIKEKKKKEKTRKLISGELNEFIIFPGDLILRKGVILVLCQYLGICT